MVLQRRPLPTIGPREAPSVDIARQLLHYLLSGEIEPGQRIPSERDLARGMGVGRSAIRDALKPLTLLGLLEVRQGDGTYLRRTSSELLPEVIEWGLLLGEKRVADLVETRVYLEGIVARLAAERRDDDALGELGVLLARMEQAGPDVDAFVDADASFHLRVAEAAGNRILADILKNIQSLSRVWMRRVAEASDRQPSHGEHVPIFEAIRRGDPDGAAMAMAAHMASASARLRATLRSEDAPSDGGGPGLRRPLDEARR